ncbi:MAG TPA: hypothetical protein VMW27_00125 [Thermoanaerobaculia bacterium]|nr:hypothetical protein [Thermoanaerobaculia bacterium]
MHRLAVRCLLPTLLCGAVAAHAGTVYVPLPGVSQVGSATYESQILISNSSAQPENVNEFLIATGSTGTQRPAPPIALQIPASRASIIRPGATVRGLAEFSGSPNLRYSARLAGLGSAGGLGVQLPVLTSENLARGGQTVTLQGLIFAGTRTTDFTLVNLGHQAAQCTVTFLRTDGTVVSPTATINMNPLSHLYVPNVFGPLVDPLVGVSEARAVVSCNREFYTYALLTNSATGEVSFVGPSGSGESTLQVPGSGPGEAQCAAGATCFTARGLVHRPTTASPVGRVTFDAPVRATTRLRLTMDVAVGDWYAADPDGKHLIYWFVINRNFDMPGMLYFRGPGAIGDVALARHGIGLRHVDKLRIQQPFQALPGHTYRIVNDYDMGRGLNTITITDLATNQVAALLQGTPNVRQVTLLPGDKFLLDMGFIEGRTPDEVPSYGWGYSNILLEVFP